MEAQLGAAHQAGLAWRDERASLINDVAAAHAEAANSRSRVADAALAAAKAAEREMASLLSSRDAEVAELRRRY